MSDKTDPLAGEILVTHSDTEDITNKGEPTIGRGLYIDVAGTIRYIDGLGNTHTKANMATGIIHPVYVQRIYSTGTTATGCYVGVSR